MTRQSAISRAIGFIALCLASFVGLTSARADIYIIESTASGVSVGAHLATDDTITLPNGSYVRAVLPSGKTQTIRGPYNGKVADIAKSTAQNEGVMAWVKNMLKTGNSTESTTGATRGVTRESGKPRAFSWAEVPSGVEGDICVLKGSKVQLTRLSSTRVDRVSVVDLASGERAEVVWEAGSQTASWPANVTVRPDATYQLFLQDRPTRRVTVHIVDTVPAEGDELTELFKFGCKHQFEAWLRERTMAAKKS